LLDTFVPWNIATVIIVIGLITIVYTLLGGMEAVIWTDVMQSVIMIVGILFCAVSLSISVFSEPESLIQAAIDNHKFSFGSMKFTLASQEHLFDRTVWVMIIYGITEALRSLLADQNYVQKYCSVPSERDAKRSVWIAMLIYIPLTAIFLYIGTALFAFYSPGGHELGEGITKGEQIFPYYIATQVPAGLKGLIIAAIIAAAMSTVDSALNCSATVLLLDFYKRYLNPNIAEGASVRFLRLATVVWGVLGTGAALLMIRAKSILDVWWQISGIFGGALLGLFLLAFMKVRLRLWQGIVQGIVSIGVSIIAISWGTFARDLPDSWRWAQCNLDSIIVGSLGTAVMMVAAGLFALMNRNRTVPA